MAQKKRQSINKKEALELFGAFGLIVQEREWYIMRLRPEDMRWISFDWYHTTGATVLNHDGWCERLGTYTDPEDLANAILGYVYEKLKK